jgi:hypothetical protein
VLALFAAVPNVSVEEKATARDPSRWYNIGKLLMTKNPQNSATLKGLGFHCGQMTPNFDGVDRFLRRFNYWADDVAHPKIFPD